MTNMSTSRQDSLVKSAHCKTTSASKYLKRLCKHFNHRVPAQWTETEGRVEFDIGVSHFSVSGDNLNIVCHAQTNDDMAEVVDTIDRHFVRFAKADSLTLTWS